MSAPDPTQSPPPQWDDMMRLTKEALTLAGKGEGTECEVLRNQLANASIAQLDYTGAGFFADLSVPECTPILTRSGVVGDIHIRAQGVDAPLGMLLFVKDGRAEMLECFAYADWPSDLRNFHCHFVRWERTDPRGWSAVDVVERDLASMWGGADA